MTISLRSDASRAVVMLDGVDRVAFNEDGSLELLTPAANPTGNKVMTVSQMPFTKEYVSGVISRTAGALTLLPHGFGSTPKSVQLYLLCVVADLGWDVGDEVDLATVDYSSGASEMRNATFSKSAAGIKVKVTANANGFVIVHASTGGAVSVIPSNTNWELRLRAWA